MTPTRTRIAPAPASHRALCWLAAGLLVGAGCFWSTHARAAQQAGAGIGEVIANPSTASTASADLRVVPRPSTDDRDTTPPARPQPKPHKRSSR